MAAIGLCMHKILRIIYGMLKHNQPYNPEVDHANRTRMDQVRSAILKDKNRRYQDYDEKAPVSKRQYNKRKERKQSQSDNITDRGIIVSIPTSCLG